MKGRIHMAKKSIKATYNFKKSNVSLNFLGQDKIQKLCF